MKNLTDWSASSDAPAVSTRDLADLARSGYEILRKPYNQVEFEVHHTVDHPGYLRDNMIVGRELSHNSTGRAEVKSVFREALVSAANEVGAIIGTSAGTETINPLSSRAGRGATADLTVKDEKDRRIFRGTALPNPTFLFESAATYEGIISVDPAPRRIRFGQSIALRDLIREIARIAADVAGAPLLFLQAPAHLPTHSYMGEDVKSRTVAAARHSSSLGVRFSIALEQPSAALRSRLTDILRRYCAERGFGLWLADSRIGYRVGNWFQICIHDKKDQSRYSTDQARAADSSTVEACVPVTLIGPARIGAAHAIMSFLGQYGDIGILSAAMTTLDDVALIHLQISARGVRRAEIEEFNSRLDENGPMLSKPVDGLKLLHDTLIPLGGDSADYVRAGHLSERAGDYQSLVGPMLPCTVVDRRKRIAVWFSWQMEGIGRDLATPLSHLFSSFSEIGLGLDDDAEKNSGLTNAPNLEYLICRDIGNSVLRGRGKLAIPEADVLAMFGGEGIESAAVAMCMRLEDTWRASIRRDDVSGASELTVAWREWWLHHWAAPI
jgi:hypothetical protein